MNNNLLVKAGDNLLNRITSISGNVDLDKLTSSIFIAQTAEIRRVLTEPLYNKILEDFTNNTLTGDYLTIYEDYISLMLMYYTASHFIFANAITINNGGNFKHSATNAQVVDYKENDRIVAKYRQHGANEELRFEKFMKTVDIPEYKNNCSTKNNSYKFPWQI